MTTPTSAVDLLDREFLAIRARLIELAAALDRIDRGEGAGGGDPRQTQIHEALETLLQPGTDRAEQVQLIFSRPYVDDWREGFARPK